MIRLVLLAAGAVAACLAVLWLSLVAGVWLALGALDGRLLTRLGTLLGLVVMACLLVEAVRLLLADLRDLERQR